MSGSPNQSLLKALDILNLFTREHQEYRLKEICDILQMPPSTAHRILRTLEEKDFIAQNPLNGKYRLGASAFIIGTNVEDINRLVDTSLPYIARLSTKFNATTHVAIEQNGHVLCVEKIVSPLNPVNTPPRGARHELHLTSLGKCMLAFSPPKKQHTLIQNIDYSASTDYSITSREALIAELKEVKKQGYAIDRKESNESLYCFGAPVFGKKNEIAGAISVSLNSNSFPKQAVEIIHDVMNSAHEISMLLNMAPM